MKQAGRLNDVIPAFDRAIASFIAFYDFFSTKLIEFFWKN